MKYYALIAYRINVICNVPLISATDAVQRSHSARHFSFFSALWLLDQLLLLPFFLLPNTRFTSYLFSQYVIRISLICAHFYHQLLSSTATDAIKPTIITWTVCCFFFFHFCCCCCWCLFFLLNWYFIQFYHHCMLPYKYFTIDVWFSCTHNIIHEI